MGYVRKDLDSELIKSLYLSGMSIEEIAKKFNTGHSTISYRLNKLGIKSRKRGYNFKGVKKSEEQIAKMVKTRKKNDSYNKPKIKIPEKDLKIMEKMYEDNFPLIYIASLFGISRQTVTRRLRERGIKIKPMLWGGKFIADDGHVVRSQGEMEIDNYLFHHKITHQYEKYLGTTNQRCDFYLPKQNIYIEYFGCMNLEKYRKKTQKKLQLYKDLKLKLIAIYPNDSIIEKLDILLTKKLGDYIEIKM